MPKLNLNEDSESYVFAGQRITIFGDREKGWAIIVNGEFFLIDSETLYRAATYQVAVEVAKQLAIEAQ